MSYDDVVKDQPGHHALALKSIVTTDASKVGQQVNVDVIARVQQVEVAKTLQNAMDLYDKGQAEEAARALDAGNAQLRQRRAKYNFKNKGRYDAAEKEMDDLKSQIQAASGGGEVRRVDAA